MNCIEKREHIHTTFIHEIYIAVESYIVNSIVLISMALEGGALSLLQAGWGAWCPPASATYVDTKS